MLLSRSRVAVFAAILTLGTLTTDAKASWCSDGNTVKFAGISWESGAFITAVMMKIFNKGYDCRVEQVPGNSIILEQATASNDIQIFAEEWVGRSDVWNKAVRQGKVREIGKTFVGASEGWFVPDYVIHGDKKRGILPMAPQLHSVSQLSDPEMVKLFADQEEPSKGRFLNCPSGWTCEKLSSAKLTAYQLDKHYVNFRPGTGTALDTAIKSAYLQGRPILFSYWQPTAIMGRFKLTQLAEPPYSDACWQELVKSDGKRDQGCAFPTPDVVYGVSSVFAKAAPQLIAVLQKATFPLAEVNSSLAYMSENNIDADAVADEFLRSKVNIWSQWVSDEAREKIAISLK